MKRLIDFCLLLLMVFWGSNAWADKTKTFSATYPTSDCNLTKLNVSGGKPQSLEKGGITLKISVADGEHASWNTAVTGSNHGQTIGLATKTNITISGSSTETKITKIVFNFEKPQIRNYAPNMIQKRKESASLVKRGHSASNVTIKTYKCPLPHHAT